MNEAKVIRSDSKLKLTECFDERHRLDVTHGSTKSTMQTSGWPGNRPPGSLTRVRSILGFRLSRGESPVMQKIREGGNTSSVSAFGTHELR